MSKVENLITLNKKLVEINYSNTEVIEILRNKDTSKYMNSIQQCKEKFEEDDKKFFYCIIEKNCPAETNAFLHCQKNNKQNLALCASALISLENYMTAHSTNLLMAIEKAKTV
jgi:hypothetical protein